MKYESCNIFYKRTARLIVFFATGLVFFGSGCNTISPKLPEESTRHGLSQGLAAVANEKGEGHKWKPPSDRPFPILAWLGPPASLLIDSAWADMARAGFNLCQPQDFTDSVSNQKALALGKKYGIGLILRDDRICHFKDGDPRKTADIEAAVRQWKAEPALAGYSIMDEPSRKDFEELVRIRNTISRLDPNHWAYVNLYGNYASSGQLGTWTYFNHVKSFMKIFQPSVLSYDHYPIVGKSVRSGYYQNLETIRAAAMKGNVPFWAFTLSLPHYDYPKPTEGHLRFQLYSDLAYGAKGLQYFTYGPAIKNDGLIDAQGHTTRTYELATKINWEIQRIGPVLLKLKSTEVFHTGPRPRGTKAFKGYGGLTKCSGAPVVLGFFNDPKGHTWLMVVNRNPFKDAELTLTFSDDVKSIEEADRTKNGDTVKQVELKGRELKLPLTAGDGRLYRINTM